MEETLRASSGGRRGHMACDITWGYFRGSCFGWPGEPHQRGRNLDINLYLKPDTEINLHDKQAPERGELKRALCAGRRALAHCPTTSPSLLSCPYRSVFNQSPMTPPLKPPSVDPRLVIWHGDFKETKNSQYCPIVRQLCHVDARNRIPPAPAKCPACDYPHGTFGAFLTYKAERAGMWLFKVS